MRKTRIAEWILSMVMSPETAASTVGDLLETEPVTSFWLSVVRTTGSMMWRDFVSEWPRMMGLAGAGLAATYLLPIVFVVISVYIVSGALGIVHLLPPIRPIVAFNLVRVSQFVGLLTLPLVTFQVGRWIARSSPGRELVPSVVLVAFEALVSLGLWLWEGLHPRGHLPGLFRFLVGNLPALPLYLAGLLFAGAVVTRRAKLRSL